MINNDFALSIGILTVVAGGIGVVWKTWVKPKLDTDLAKRNSIYAMVDKMYPMVEKVHNEMSVNGGTSVKDGISALSKSMNEVNFRINGIEEVQKMQMDMAGDCFWQSNEEGDCIFASRGLCKMLDKPVTDILDSGWVGSIYHEDRERVYKEWVFSVENRSPFDSEYRLKSFVEYETATGETKHKPMLVWGLAYHKYVNDVHISTLGKLEEIKK